jgi:hypothetical protein
VTTDSTGSASACEPYRAFIEQGLLAGRNAMSIWQELVDRHGLMGVDETARPFVRRLAGPATPGPDAIIITSRGDAAQAGDGTGPRSPQPKCRFTPPPHSTALHSCFRSCARRINIPIFASGGTSNRLRDDGVSPNSHDSFVIVSVQVLTIPRNGDCCTYPDCAFSSSPDSFSFVCAFTSVLHAWHRFANASPPASVSTRRPTVLIRVGR